MALGQPFYTYPNAGYNPYQAPAYNGYQQTMPYNAPNATVGGFQAQGQANTQPQAQQAVMPTKTNVPLVTSLTEAMSKTTELNSDTFYADQDNPFIYRVSVDMQGRKTYRTFELKDVTEQVVENGAQSTPNIDLSAYATKADLTALKDEIMGYASAYISSVNQPSSTSSTTSQSKPKKSVSKEEVEEIFKE